MHMAALTVFMIPATTAMADVAPNYEEFEGCPGKDVNEQVVACFITTVTGGHLQMGSKDSPIVDPIRLAGALVNDGSDGGSLIVGEFDGGHQPIPGGLVGITGLNWLVNLFPANLLKVYAHTELAGAPTSPLLEPFSFPIKVKLENPLLSSTCYIGSNANPINLQLISGTTDPPAPNQPISGHFGEPIFDPDLAGPVIRVNDQIMVDNSFAAPAAQGCTLLLPGLGVVDALVNLQSGLPSAAGRNEAVQELAISLGGVEAVYPPDGFEQ
jgi:hypothetical protein